MYTVTPFCVRHVFMRVGYSLYLDRFQGHKHMTHVFRSGFCPQTDVEEASPRWGKSSKLVLVSLLLAGLLLAALLVAGYYLKTHRNNSKGVRLVSGLMEVSLLMPSEPTICSCLYFGNH